MTLATLLCCQVNSCVVVVVQLSVALLSFTAAAVFDGPAIKFPFIPVNYITVVISLIANTHTHTYIYNYIYIYIIYIYIYIHSDKHVIFY